METVTGNPAADGTCPKPLGGLTVTVAGVAADLFLISPTQINFVVPLIGHRSCQGNQNGNPGSKGIRPSQS
jgi:uncharacterized protein (TIGR03437 family)